MEGVLKNKERSGDEEEASKVFYLVRKGLEDPKKHVLGAMMAFLTTTTGIIQNDLEKFTMAIESGSPSTENYVSNNGVNNNDLSSPLSSGKKGMKSAAFNTNGSGGAGYSRSPRPNHSPTGNTNTNFKTNYSQTSSYSGNMPRMICDYCKRTRHIREKCYKLHGYPQTNNNPQGNNYQNFNQNGYRDNNQNSRFNRRKGLMADVHGCSGEENNGGAHTDTTHQLTREQYVQFMELLQQFQTEKDNAKHMDNVLRRQGMQREGVGAHFHSLAMECDYTAGSERELRSKVYIRTNMNSSRLETRKSLGDLKKNKALIFRANKKSLKMLLGLEKNLAKISAAGFQGSKSRLNSKLVSRSFHRNRRRSFGLLSDQICQRREKEVEDFENKVVASLVAPVLNYDVTGYCDRGEYSRVESSKFEVDL
ncbi:hypothetical protein H5410_048781 [Solanum commersonii]|uniref:Uncharacterized protein n=1 Tax=Solanum commersonii TaxID=4109 RepID=A0A9J5XJ63_SOLCO|nr:hypothetical protein H5410_048781 [Solanum commersonii]